MTKREKKKTSKKIRNLDRGFNIHIYSPLASLAELIARARCSTHDDFATISSHVYALTRQAKARSATRRQHVADIQRANMSTMTGRARML